MVLSPALISRICDVAGRVVTRANARLDAEFNETDHPRAEDGKFGSGGGSAGSSREQLESEVSRLGTEYNAALKAARENPSKANQDKLGRAERAHLAAHKELKRAGQPGRGEKKTAASGKASPVKTLEEKLGGIAPGRIVAPHQAASDPDLDLIIERGKSWTKGEVDADPAYLGPDSQCHWNTSKLFRDGKIDAVVIGYAKNSEGWHQHTWGTKGGKVVETTESNHQNSDWFGAPLSAPQSKKFAEHALREGNKPGQGNVRTSSGGHKVGGDD